MACRCGARDRNGGGGDPPGVVYIYAPGRGGEHVLGGAGHEAVLAALPHEPRPGTQGLDTRLRRIEATSVPREVGFPRAHRGGTVVAIEPESGTWFLGGTLGQANAAAYAQFPDRWVYFCRLDDPDSEIALPTW